MSLPTLHAPPTEDERQAVVGWWAAGQGLAFVACLLAYAALVYWAVFD
jgi:hypothetical protein